MVPNHYLSAEIEQRFLDLGVLVKIFRGRMQPDPENPNALMCSQARGDERNSGRRPADRQDLLQVARRHVRAFRRRRHLRIPEAEDPIKVPRSSSRLPIWRSTISHALGDPELVVIDESVWKKALRGVEDRPDFSFRSMV